MTEQKKDSIKDLIAEIERIYGSNPSGEHLAGRAYYWLKRYQVGVPNLITVMSRAVAYRRIMRAEVEALISDLDKARASGGVYTYAAVQQRLRNAMATADKEGGEPGGGEAEAE